jgi:Glutamate decarboxylase and related PLP-dependent proteins
MASDEYGRRQLAPNNLAVENLGTAVQEWILPFVTHWISSGVQPLVSREEEEQLRAFVRALGGTLPEGYAWLPDLLERLAGAMRFNDHNFVNIHPTPYVPAIAAAAVVALQNPNNIVPDVSRATTALEEEAVQWMAELVGFDPRAAWGNVVSGGTIANLTALLVARDYTFRKLGRPRPSDLRTRGLYGRTPGVVLASAGSHYSVKKAAWILGLGDENVIAIPVAYDEAVKRNAARDAMFLAGITDLEWADRLHGSVAEDRARGEKEMDAFYRGTSQPFSLQPLNSEIFKAMYACFTYSTPLIAYVFTVGTTDTGTIEAPDAKALQLLATEDVFIHADAAAGGFGLVHPRIKARATGLARVHSVTLDAHKLGHLSYPNGAVLFRDRGWMYEIMHEAPYLQGLSPTIEGSRSGCSSAALWAAIQDLGTAGYHAWMGRLLQFMDALVNALEATDLFQVLHNVHLTSVAVAPRISGSTTRREVNQLVLDVHKRIREDTSSAAFLVNVDRGLAGIKVLNAPGTDDEDLVDIFCWRIVAANPAAEPADAMALVDYLARQVATVRRK